MRNPPTRLPSLAMQLQSVAGQLQSLSVTSVQELNADSKEIDNIKQHLIALETKVSGIQQDLRDLQASFDAEKVKLSAVYADLVARNATKHNADAIAYNSTANKHMNLIPLQDPKAGEPFPGFPKTLACVDNMESTQLDQLLRALNFDYFPNPLTPTRKRARLIAALHGVEEHHPTGPLHRRLLDHLL